MAESDAGTNQANIIQNPKTEKKILNEGLVEHLPVAVLQARPTSLDLTQSLSQSVSDLLVSPLEEENGGLAGRSGFVSNGISGQSSLHIPSFASEWDEVIVTLWGWETSFEVCRKIGIVCVCVCILTISTH